MTIESILALSPLERVEAASTGLSGSSVGMPDILGQWTVWLPSLVTVIAGITLLVLYRRWNRRRRAYAACLESADRLGLLPEERDVMLQVATLAELGSLDTIFSMPEAFNVGAERLLATRAIQDLASEGQQQVKTVVESVRSKMGFRKAPSLQAPPSQRLGLRTGSTLTVVSHETPRPVQATLLKVTEDGVVVQTDDFVKAVAGAEWRVRYTDQGLQWEVDTTVMEGADQRVFLRLAQEPRCVNRRRFIRMPVRHKAGLARFPFQRSAGDGDRPVFVEGLLTEIGGSGVRIDLPLRTQPGERVLAVMELSEGKIVEAVGVVRRVVEGAPAVLTIVELLGLSNADINLLVKETMTVPPRAFAVREMAAVAGSV
jgi:hypothetical protein